MAEGEESVGNGVSGSRTTAAAATLAELQALRANQARLEGLVESLSLGRKPIPPPPSLASTMASQAQLVTSTPPIDFDGLILGDGVEYRDWSSYMELVMAELGYTDHLEARTPTDPPSSTWVIADRKARFALFKGLSKPDIALAMRYKTVGEAWEFFKTRAGRTGALNLHKQLQLVASCQQDRTEGAQAFLARLRALQRDVEESLAAYEFSYPEPLTVWHLLTGLRSDYEACKLSLYTHNVTALDAVLQALVLHEEALRHSSDSDKLRRVQATSPSPSPKRQQSSSSSASPSSTSASSVSSAGGQWAYHQPLTGPGCNVCGDLSHNYSKCAFYVRSVEILKRAGRLIPRGAPNTPPPRLLLRYPSPTLLSLTLVPSLMLSPIPLSSLVLFLFLNLHFKQTAAPCRSPAEAMSPSAPSFYKTSPCVPILLTLFSLFLLLSKLATACGSMLLALSSTAAVSCSPRGPLLGRTLSWGPLIFFPFLPHLFRLVRLVFLLRPLLSLIPLFSAAFATLPLPIST